MDMPAKNYRKPDAKSYMLRVRMTEKERKLLEKAVKKSGGTVSRWVRDLAVREAEEILGIGQDRRSPE